MDEDQMRRSGAPGFRFYPTEEELLAFYLRNKLHNLREDDMKRVIPVFPVHQLDPWNLSKVSGEASIRDSEQLFFFCPRHEREAHGGRPIRTTPSGYWKATGSQGFIYSSSNQSIGVKRTMVFYRGRAPSGTKTKWKMNEYRAFQHEGHGATTSSNSTPELNREFSLCRVYTKLGCLRSFDRRPSASSPISTSRRMLEHSDENSPAAKRSRSHDSSSFEDRGDPSSPIGDIMDLKMLEGIEWESLDWI